MHTSPGPPYSRQHLPRSARRSGERGSGAGTPPGSHMRGLHPEEIGIGRLFWLVREAVIAADVRNGRVVLWNPGAEALFGYPAEMALRLCVEELVPERARAELRAGRARYVALGESSWLTSPVPLELPALRSDGALLDVEATFYSLDVPSPDGGPVVMALVRDVTPRRRLEAEHLTRERLHGALLAARAAQHEIGQHLAISLGFAEILALESQDARSDLREMAERVVDAARQAASALGRLQSVTHLEEGAGSPSLEPPAGPRSPSP